MNKYTKSGPTTKFENKIIEKMSQQDLYTQVPEDFRVKTTHDEENPDPFVQKTLPHEEHEIDTLGEKITGHKNLSARQKIHATSNRADTVEDI